MKDTALDNVSRQNLDAFRDLLANHMGLNFGAEKEEELLNKLKKVVDTFGMQNPEDCIHFLKQSNMTKSQIATLAKDLSVGETYFFRHSQTFQALEKQILPEVIGKKKQKDSKVSVWSAACCSGEELYSIAILLKELTSKKEKWEINLLGTDINQDFLEKAKAGLYKEWSFRSMPQHYRKVYFKKIGENKNQLAQDVKKMARFEYLNLVKDHYPSSEMGIQELDLILCCNVLIYFTQESIKAVVSKLANSLAEGGWLIVSPIEIPFIDNKFLVPYRAEDFFCFRKQTCRNIQQPKPPVVKRKAPLPAPKPPSPIISHAPVKENQKQAVPVQRVNAESIESIKKLANKGDILKAKELCENMLLSNTVDPLLYYLYGVLQQESDCLDLAIASFKNALFLDPAFVMCHFSLALLMQKCGEHAMAKKHFRNVIDLLKDFPPQDVLPGSDDLTAERLQLIAININAEL